MPTVALEALLILALIVVNGLLSMSEMAVTASRKVRLQERADRGDAGAQAALELAHSPNRFLSTVQIGITLVGILTGAFGGARLAAVLSGPIARVPGLAPYSAGVSLGIVVLLITFLSLVLGELVPKRLALNAPERIASMVARPMMALSRFAGPLVAVLGASTDLALRLLGMRRNEEAPVTEEEIRTMIGQGAEAGVFEPGEQDLVDGVLSLADLQVGELMTPRTRLVALDADDPPEVNARKMAESPHAHFPLYRGSLDALLGIVSVKDVWAQAAGDPAAGGRATPTRDELERLARPPFFVPESLRALRLLEVFRHGRPAEADGSAGAATPAEPVAVAVVIGEHGGTEGLITLTDVLEAIVGDLPDGSATGAAEAVRREDGSLLVDGQMAADELKALIGAAAAPDPAREDYHTVGGFVMTHLGRVPAAGDWFDWEGHRVEVLDMDGRRVDKVLVTARPSGESGASDDDPAGTGDR